MSLGAAERPLRSLLGSVGWEDAPIERLAIQERPKALATPWPIAALGSAALGAVGLAASRIHELRTGERSPVSLDTRAAELAMASSSYLLVDGKPAKFRDPFTGFYLAADGQWVYLHGNFAHLRDGLLAMLGAVNEEESVRAAVAERTAGDIEAEAIRRGLCAARVRQRKDWLREKQAVAVVAQPPVLVEKIAATPPAPLPPGGDRPLSGLRMLDLSRVIAGPMTGRTMAEHGATVMRIASPSLPSITSLVIDTGFGKHAAFADLETEEGRASLQALCADADVFLDAYRPASLSGRGFGAADLRRFNAHLVSLSLSAFSPRGPWWERRGYDSLVQATMGMAMEQAGQRPTLLPCQPLDYLTGYLAAFGAMVALIRRHEEGGRWQVTLSLAATAHWMWRMRDELGDDAAYPPANPDLAAVADLLETHDSDFGRVTALMPALRLDGERARWSRMPVPLGRDPARWPKA